MPETPPRPSDVEAPDARLRLAFLGSPDFAVPVLDALHAAGHEIACVYSQPPKPAGRGRRLAMAPVHRRAEALGLPVRTPSRLRRESDEWAFFAGLGLDVAVVAAYGLILPAPMLAAPRRGCLNVHASLLPRWRGASPIQSAILAGDAETGVTIMQMDEGLDTGAMLLRGAIPIAPDDTGASLHDRLAPLGAALVLRALAERPAPVPQPAAGVTLAPKLGREDGAIDWTLDAAAIERRIRALSPWPGTHTTLDGETLKILEAEFPDAASGSGPAAHAAPGSILGADLLVACGVGALRLRRVVAPGRQPTDGAAFLRGRRWSGATRLGGPASTPDPAP